MNSNLAQQRKPGKDLNLKQNLVELKIKTLRSVPTNCIMDNKENREIEKAPLFTRGVGEKLDSFHAIKFRCSYVIEKISMNSISPP